jgi:hypothetical protein
MKVEHGSIWGFWQLLANFRLEAQFLLGVTAGLNNEHSFAVGI